MDAPISISQSKHDRILLAHAVLGSVAALIVAPAAILVGRYLRTWRHWATLHAALNVFTVLLVVVTFALGNVATGAGEYVGPSADVHHKLGLAVTVIALVQAILGIAARFTKVPPHNYVVVQARRNPLRIVHILFGIASLAILYAQVYTGFGEWNGSTVSQTTTPTGVVTAFWVLLAIEVFFYVIGWPLMEITGRKRRNARPDEVLEKD